MHDSRASRASEDEETVRSTGGEASPHGWALGRGLALLWDRLRAEWAGLSRRRLWTALGVLLGGAALVAALSYGLTRLAMWMEPRGLRAWDERVLLWFEAHGPMSFHDAILAESAGNLSYLIPVTLMVAVIAVMLRRPLVGIAILVSYWGVRPMVLLGWWTWDRARPTLIADGIAAPGLHAFPSGHAALAISVYGLLAYLWIRRSGSWIEKALAIVLATVWIAMVSVARVRLGSHWMSDIIGGAIVGLAWLGVVIVALRTAEQGRVHAQGARRDP